MRLLGTVRSANILGEGPLWNDRDGALWWTDIQARRLHRLSFDAGTFDTTETPERVGSLAFLPEKGPRILAAFETGLAYFDVETKAVDWIARPEALGNGRRFNDGRTDRQGRFWVGTMVENKAKAGADTAALFRLDRHGALTEQQGGVWISNSLCVSPDGRTLYFADSPRKVIWAFDLDAETGTLSGRRVFAEVEAGEPDGSVIDEEGCLWSARWGASEVVRHAPDGRVIERIPTLASQPSCVAFGGPDRKTLFVTSAREGLDAAKLAADPEAGNLFVFEVEVAGLPVVPFKPGS